MLKSGLPATTRHVLLTISCFMNDVGGGCYPTQEQIAEATGLTDRAVRQHIDAAVKAGWIKRKEHGFRGQKWRNHEYEASWPAQDVDEGELHVVERAERGSGPLAEGAERHAEGAEPDDKKVRNDVPTILPVQHSNQRSVRARASLRDEFEEEVFSVFPKNPGCTFAKAFREYARLNERDRALCRRGVVHASIRFEDAVTDEPVDKRLKFHQHLSTWISERGWEAELALS